MAGDGLTVAVDTVAGCVVEEDVVVDEMEEAETVAVGASVDM